MTTLLSNTRPLSLPPPTILAPRAQYTTLQTPSSIPQAPPSLPPTPPPFNLPSFGAPESHEKVSWNALPAPPGMESGGAFSMAAIRRALASKQKTVHYDFAYADRDKMANEINEFFHHHDLMFLHEGQELFEQNFASKWTDATVDQKTNYIEAQLDLLELKNPTERAHACRRLLYIAVGTYAELPADASIDTHLKLIQENTELLLSCGAVLYIYRALRIVSSAMDVATRVADPGFSIQDRQAIIDLANIEASVCLATLYMIVEVNLGNERLAVELGEGDVPVAGHLFVLVSQLSDSNRKHYPAKKASFFFDRNSGLKTCDASKPLNHVLLLLWKTLMASLGDSVRLQELKNTARSMEGLPSTTAEDPYVKAAPGDYQQLQTILTNRYPAYVLPDAHIMATPSVEKLNLAAYPPSPRPTPWEPPSPLQPFINPDPETNPSFFDETISKFKQYSYISLGTVQFAKEKAIKDRTEASMYASDRAMTGGCITDWLPSESSVESDESAKTTGLRHDHQNKDALERIDQLYRYLLPNMSTHIVMLVRLIYYVNLDGRSQDGSGGPPDGQSFPDNQSPQSSLENADATRHREVVTKAVSAIIVVLLKATRCRNIFLFEYISQLLIDHNCSILVLKLLSTWFQNQNNNPSKPVDLWNDAPALTSGTALAAAFLKESIEPAQLNFFHFCRKQDTDKEGNASPPMEDIASVIDSYDSPVDETNETINEKDDTQEFNVGSWRNFFTVINLMRVLQKLSKRKSHRILALIHWKASAVLKRVVKVGHVGLQLYALKLLKGQIPYLGRKWRSSNMKVITSIYLHLRPYLRDEYLSGDLEVDGEEALSQEHQLRGLIAFYHRRVYGDLINTNNPETANGFPKSAHETQDDLDLVLMLHEAGSRSLPSIRPSDPHAYRASSQELDENFIQNYEQWLQTEVFEAEHKSPTRRQHSSRSESSDDEYDAWGIRETSHIPAVTDLPPAYNDLHGFIATDWDDWIGNDEEEDAADWSDPEPDEEAAEKKDPDQNGEDSDTAATSTNTQE
ncbi:hypothetical protein SmJEL517_g04691 [Synchytrium microbalum]|uniref:Far11/STRP C-terminal domain-containing protein n=1 Tax=Synchytrium microbalum TaxID=1806994 RepID=A0A507BYE6_9FUNG|nr:uncharacterized protein SmJEL517_g04691 [Synchytrium microbalum]TPX32148.1 hypothetical protein SmJEL517_g04691 [Synchytrium microbalum]